MVRLRGVEAPYRGVGGLGERWYGMRVPGVVQECLGRLGAGGFLAATQRGGRRGALLIGTAAELARCCFSGVLGFAGDKKGGAWSLGSIEMAGGWGLAGVVYIVGLRFSNRECLPKVRA